MQETEGKPGPNGGAVWSLFLALASLLTLERLNQSSVPRRHTQIALLSHHLLFSAFYFTLSLSPSAIYKRRVPLRRSSTDFALVRTFPFGKDQDRPTLRSSALAHCLLQCLVHENAAEKPNPSAKNKEPRPPGRHAFTWPITTRGNVGLCPR